MFAYNSLFLDKKRYNFTPELISKLETILDEHRSNYYNADEIFKKSNKYILSMRVARWDNQYYIYTLQKCNYTYSNNIYHFCVNKYIHIEFDEKTNEWKLCMTGLH